MRMTRLNTSPPSSRSIRVREHEEEPSKEDISEKYHEYIVSIGSVGDHEVENVSPPLTSNRRQRWKQTPLRILQDLFLPVGYPASVGDAYLDYQIYDSIQGLSSYLRGVLCSASVLQAAGVGSSQATALSAAMTWALKDGVSMLGGLMFSYTTSHMFDPYVKEFRLFADLINDVGLTLDMLDPYFSNLLVVASLAGLCKTLCGLSAGATKSSITCHFALEGNMADLNAKEATQETLVSLIGMLLGISLAHQLSRLQESGNHELVVQVQWITFLSLTVLHVWANWRGVKLLRLRTLNQPRAEWVLENLEHLLMKDPNKVPDRSLLEKGLSTLSTPSEVHESLLHSFWGMLAKPLFTYAGLTDILRIDPNALSTFGHEHYVLTLRPHNVKSGVAPSQSSMYDSILVTLLAGANAEDQLKAFVHCRLLKRFMENHHGPVLLTWTQRHDVLRHTLDCVNLLFPTSTTTNAPSSTTPDSRSRSLLDALETRGWEVRDRVYLGFPRRRSEWIPNDKKQE